MFVYVFYKYELLEQLAILARVLVEAQEAPPAVPPQEPRMRRQSGLVERLRRLRVPYRQMGPLRQPRLLSPESPPPPPWIDVVGG